MMLKSCTVLELLKCRVMCRFHSYCYPLFVGDLFDHGHLTRAVCCRVEDAITDKLTNGFRLNHPYIGRVTFCESHKNPMPSKMLNWSVNWSLDDEKIEIINGRVGKAVPE